MKRLSRLLWSFLLVSAVIIILVVVVWIGNSLSAGAQGSEQSVYWGPPTADAKYSETLNITLPSGTDQVTFNTNNTWRGIVFDVRSSSVVNGSIELLSPDGLRYAYNDLLLEKTDVSNGTSLHSGRIVSFNPNAVTGEVYGTWTVIYSFNGGPVDLVIDRIDSFGTPK